MVILRSLAGMALAAVRRLQTPPVGDRSSSLTIGALIMGDTRPETPSVAGVPSSRRGLAYSAVLAAARELLVARFALARALDKLTTEEILELLDEVDETANGDATQWPKLHVTHRDENL